MSFLESPFLIASLLVGLSSLGFGLFVLIKAPQKRFNQLWFIFSLSVAVWGFGGVWGTAEHNPHAALLKWRIVNAAGITWIPVLYFHFICRFLEIRRPRILLLSYLIGTTFACLSLTPWIFSEVRYLWNEMYWPVAGPIHPLFFLWWTALIFYSHWELWLHYKRSTGIHRSQIKLFFLASAIGYFCGALEYLPDYRIDLYPWSNFGVALYPYLMMYAILQYRLFDISFVIRRSFLYFIVVALLIAGYSGLVYTAQQLFQMTLLQHHILALSFTAITTFGLGLLVFLAKPKRRLNQIFGLYSLAISWWAFCEAFVVGAKDPVAATFWSYIEWPGVIFIAPTFIHTVFLATGEKSGRARVVLIAAYIAGFTLLLLHLLTNLITLPPRPVGYALFHNNITRLGFLIPLTFLILVNIALWKLCHAYREAQGRRRTPLKYLFWSSVVGYLSGSPDWFFVFGFYAPLINPFGIYGVPMYSIATTYAVLQHRLFDVNLVIRKSFVYSLLVTVLTVGYFGLVYGAERIFKTTLGYQSIWFSLAAFALMAFAFQPLKIWIQRFVDWLIFRVPQEELARRMERLEREVRQVEKLRAVGTLAAGLCHELRNPLQAIQTHAEFLPESYDDPGFRQRCSEVMRTEIGRINDLLRQLMEFAKPKPPSFHPVQPHQIIDSTADLLNNDFVRRQIHFEKRYEANGSQVQADADQLRQVVLNLLLNALQAVGENGRITVSTHEEGGWYTLEISDNGPGIDPKILPKLFEPFNTTKPDGNGLGLSIVHSIVQEHRGRIRVCSDPDQGATFTLQLPLD